MLKLEGGELLKKGLPHEFKGPFEKKQAVELKFNSVTYETQTFQWGRPFIERKEILHGVSGEFQPGCLTAIMGPSGAGKSTLLNVVAGYKVDGVGGQILINGEERMSNELKKFLSISCYIQQDSSLRENLTVQESMMIAAELKIGRKVRHKSKELKVHEILTMLGLERCLNTMSKNLSGGQQKRLSIALELLTNPPVIFLDEPTTGLDSSSSSQCVSILKMLAREGRTVVATIHTPSALIFEMFDNLYALSDGHCIYNGTIKSLVPYLSSKGLNCPIYHNPADYLIEVAIGEHGPICDKLILREDKSKEDKRKTEANLSLKSCWIEEIKKSIKKQKIFPKENLPTENYVEHCSRPNSFIMEFYYLYMRSLIILQRGYKYRLITSLAHFSLSTLLGLTFYHVGNDATMARSNLFFLFAMLMFLIFVGLMTITVNIPSDIRCLKAEHFNQWYSLFPYYLSHLSIEMPVQTLNIIVAFTPMYLLSDQPMELFRVFMFVIVGTATTLAAQAHGFLVGVSVPLRLAVFVGPVSSCFLAALGFTLRTSDAHIIIQVCSLLSYVRSSFVSLVFIIFGFGREPLRCDEKNIYCHFKFPVKLLKEMDMESINIYANLTYIIAVIGIVHIITYIILHRQLTKR